MQRYFVTKENEKFILLDNDFHHIKDVMRLKNNDQIICIYDKKSYLCTISFDSTSYNINIIKEVTVDNEFKEKIILYQALIRNEKFDLVIQKATELGVSEIYPTICQRSIIKINNEKEEAKIKRYNKIIKEACEQSHRQEMAICHNYLNLNQIRIDNDTLGLIAYENEANYNSLNVVLKNIKDYKKIAIVIGPEGGFSFDEVQYLLNMGFQSVSLGKRILRSETASLYLLSILNYVLGD